MYVEVNATAEGTGFALREPDDFKSFKVVSHGVATEDRARALDGVGRLEDSDHAYLSIPSVLELAGARADDPEWRASFDGMVTYASSKGWLDADGGAIRAHWEDS